MCPYRGLLPRSGLERISTSECERNCGRLRGSRNVLCYRGPTKLRGQRVDTKGLSLSVMVEASIRGL